MELRLLWLSVILGMMTWFTLTVKDLVVDVVNGNTVDVREIKYEDSLPFPSVTICNHNYFRTSVPSSAS